MANKLAPVVMDNGTGYNFLPMLFSRSHHDSLLSSMLSSAKRLLLFAAGPNLGLPATTTHPMSSLPASLLASNTHPRTPEARLSHQKPRSSRAILRQSVALKIST